MARTTQHKGIREFTADEISNLAIGQNGFDVIEGAEVEAGVTSGYTDVKYWIALKAVDVNAEVEARTLQGIAGDDLTLGSGGDYTGSDPVTIENGDIVYGVFDKVKVNGSDYILAYRGN